MRSSNHQPGVHLKGRRAPNSLSPREFMLARLAALIAADAPPVSYFSNASLGIAIAVADAEMAGVGSQP